MEPVQIEEETAHFLGWLNASLECGDCLTGDGNVAFCSESGEECDYEHCPAIQISQRESLEDAQNKETDLLVRRILNDTIYGIFGFFFLYVIPRIDFFIFFNV